MTFHIIAAYGIATITAGLLSWVAVRNYRAGWRRERSNVVLDSLMAWAEANQEMRRAQEKSKVFSAAPASVGNQLAALHAALNVNAGIAPAPGEVAAEQKTVPVAVSKS